MFSRRKKHEEAHGAAFDASGQTSQTMPAEERQAAAGASRRPNNRTLRLFTFVVVLVILIGGVAVWRIFIWQPAVVNPFNARTLASAQFPLYYPKQVPAGYRIDAKSVTEPQAGVVVFNLVGPHKEKLYISEEVRPTSFDFGGFYKKFADLKTTATPQGEIAAGQINNGQTEIGSLAFATTKTWVLTNTSAPVSSDQITAMLKSLALSY